MFPGAQEVCDGVDQDCDGLTDHDNPVIVGPVNLPTEFPEHRRVPHWDTAAALGILDNERATKISGAMFTMQRGAGATLALPLLDAMIPAMTAESKTAAKAPPRFFAGFVPHGAAPGYWIPEKAGALPAELPFIWKPLEPYRQHLNILTGLHSRSSEPPPGETGADHWVAAAYLCAQKPRKTARGSAARGPVGTCSGAAAG